MTSTENMPAHAEKLLAWLNKSSPVTFTDEGIFACWKETDLSDLEMISALDWLSIRGLIVRSTDQSLRCEVKVKS